MLYDITPDRRNSIRTARIELLPCFPGESGTGRKDGNMAAYKLDYYRGVTFEGDTTLVRKVASLVSVDADGAKSCQTEHAGDILVYALIELEPEKKVNRYLCYQARSSGYMWMITLIYLEGVATLEDLHSMFEKQETKK